MVIQSWALQEPWRECSVCQLSNTPRPGDFPPAGEANPAEMVCQSLPVIRMITLPSCQSWV